MHDLGSVLLAQLTAVRDEQPDLPSGIACDQTFAHGVNLAGRSLADIFAGSLTITERKESA